MWIWFSPTEAGSMSMLRVNSFPRMTAVCVVGSDWLAVLAGVVWTSTDVRPSTTTATLASAMTRPRSRRGDRSTLAAIDGTVRRESPATPRMASTSVTLTRSSHPYVLVTRASTVPTRTIAWATPVRTSTATAYEAQRDHTGTIAPSSAALARGSRKTISMSRPPSHTLIAEMCSRSDATVTIGTLEALGWPD